MSNPLSISPGAGGLPRALITASDGSRAEVYLNGAQVTSWVPAGGQEVLFLSARSAFRPGAAIRGGVPVIFPQFSDLGPYPRHGFARTATWEPAGSQELGKTTIARFTLRDDAATRAAWPYPFALELAVSLRGPQLAITLAATNTGTGPFAFTAALHTYLSVGDLDAVFVSGLGGVRFLDNTAGRVERVQAEPELRFTGEIDRIYLEPPGALRLREPGRTLTISQDGFRDSVVWNPGPAKGAALADLEPGDYRHFVCIEAAAAGRPVRLQPGGRWEGTQVLSA